MDRSLEIADLAAALAAAQAQMANPRLDRVNPHFRTKYASLAAVREAVVPALSAQGLAVTQLLATEGDVVHCQTVLWHASGQWMSTVFSLPVQQPTPQGYAATATYARRIALQALCCVAGEEDDEDRPLDLGTAWGRTHEDEQPETAPQQSSRPVPPPRPGTILRRIRAVYEALGHDSAWLTRYWQRACSHYQVATPDAIPLTGLQALLVQARQVADTRRRVDAVPSSATPEASSVAQDASSPLGQSNGEDASVMPAHATVEPRRDSVAWDTLRAHAQDSALSAPVLASIAEALHDPQTSESAAQRLAGVVLDCLNAGMEETILCEKTDDRGRSWRAR